METGREELEDDLEALIEANRVRCLWFLRGDYHPRTTAEKLQVLAYIERHGDLSTFRRVARLKRWLLHPSNELSASD